MGEKIHLIAVCGTGMGSLAALLVEAGHEVRGSDANVYPPMSDLLRKAGVVLMEGYRPENLAWGPDRVIVGNAVRRTNPEAEAAERSGARIDSFPSALADLFLAGRRSLVVAGTHGKSTTSAMVAHALHHAGRDPSFLVGGVLKGFDATTRLGRGPHFVVEGDEYDTAYFDKGSKFLHYRPASAIVTSVEFDHADIFASLDAIHATFAKFAALVPPDGRLVVHESVPEGILAGARAPVMRYGEGAGCAWRMREFRHGPFGLRFAAERAGEVLGEIALPMTGRHNGLNALAVLALLDGEGLAFDEIARALAVFQGVKRRQETIAEAAGVTVIDDFAHHPTAVATTLEGLRARYGARRVIALFEPRTATSRRAVFQADYPKAFDAADLVVVADVFNKDALAEGERFRSERLVDDLTAQGRRALFLPTSEAILTWAAETLRPGDVVAFLSNGDFGGLRKSIPEMLRARDGSGL